MRFLSQKLEKSGNLAALKQAVKKSPYNVSGKFAINNIVSTAVCSIKITIQQVNLIPVLAKLNFCHHYRYSSCS